MLIIYKDPKKFLWLKSIIVQNVFLVFLIHTQLSNFPYKRLLNKLYEYEVSLTGQTQS